MLLQDLKCIARHCLQKEKKFLTSPFSSLQNTELNKRYKQMTSLPFLHTLNLGGSDLDWFLVFCGVFGSAEQNVFRNLNIRLNS